MNILVVGRRKEGKSTLALYLAKQSHKAVIVFDPRGMFDGEVVTSGEELQEALDERADHGWTRQSDELPIVYRYDGSDPEGAFAEMSDVLFPPQFVRGGFALIVDEAGELQTANQITPELRRAVAQHPTEGDMRVSIIQTSHRMSEFHGKSKALMDDLYIFRTTHPRDVAALLDFTGEPEVLPVVQELPPHHLVWYKFARQESGPQFEIWDQPEIWFAPIEGSERAKANGPGAAQGGAGSGRLPSPVLASASDTELTIY